MNAWLDTPPAPLTDEQVEANTSHFIPPLELTGSRAEKLRKLDTLILYLQKLRSDLAGSIQAGLRGYERPSPHAATPAWPWFSAGLLLGALFVALLVGTRSCG